MANTWYPKFCERLLRNQVGVDVTAGGTDVRCVLVDLADYTYSASHVFLSDVPSGARVATTGALTGKSATNGLFDATDTTFTAPSGDQSEALIYYIHTGTDSTSQLMAFVDTTVGGMPITPASVDIALNWHATGIAQL